MENWDLIVIGAGPAGISAAIWGSDLGLRTLVLESRRETGGQLLSVHNPIRNYLGKDAAYGAEFRDFMLEQLDRSNAILSLSSRVASADLVKNVVCLDNGRKHKASASIIATGVRRRELGVPGERELTGKGILESGVRDRADVVGRHVAIVGGGDAALENAILLSETAARVTVIHRRDKFKARTEFLSRVSELENVDVLLNSTVTKIRGDDELTGIELNTGSETRTLACDNLLIRIGVQPNSELVQGQVATDTAGYVIVDRNCRTNLDHVFAAGDIAAPLAPTISTAAGMAATATKVIARGILTD